MKRTKFAAADLTAGQLNAIVMKLGGEERARDFLRDKLVVVPRDPRVFPVWKTIKLGTNLQSSDDFRHALKAAGSIDVDPLADAILGQEAFTVLVEETEVDLVVVSAGRLAGFRSDVIPEEEIYDRADAFGLELCPPEVGPQLCLQRTDRRLFESLVIAMEPIAHPRGNHQPFLFATGHFFRKQELLALQSGSWEGGTNFVFVCPRQ